MPRHCSAIGCTTRDTRETRNRCISFHRLPKKHNPRRITWLENCRRTDPSGERLWDPSSEYIYFCSKHFERSCFEVVGFSGYHRLKETAVPTIFEDFVKLQNVKARTQGLAHKARPVRRRKRLALLRAHTPVPAIPDSASTVPIGGEAIAGASPRMTDGCHLHDLRTGSDHVPGSTAPAEGSEAAAVELETHPSATLEDGQDAEPPSDCVMVPPPDVFATPSQRPVSPSAYMLRLPPPPGAYIQSEHSYHVGSALLWKRRAEAALDALDKAQRQLQACKRREHRLRLRIHALQQERAREKRGQSDVRERLKEHLQVFALELINDYVSPCSSEVTAL
ncbi:THAP domain-containing protein 7 isoform X2 [Microcaecilia unicolor]|uniref:THAP domain-containing protein 7 isoform X2 n=1 Tax=Microcaecilia unicolor TaxID=1415580 RepID=A0A6P7XKR9_9AMPH|nr:THAP domain-containing protein 7 isoform X2 [Microcaecilia unicolor]XP_030051255.1 THAP domain-containing protein 7 isoform X2 [Microcaecilia unicolor]